jgi:arylsulfatase A-like enzyme
MATAGPSAQAAGSQGRTEGAKPRPNILLLISDDQAWSAFDRTLMPSVYGQLVDQGVLFKRAYVNTSLCCPSRAQILTGLYEHHTGVDANEIALDRPTFPQALHDSGYRTMLAGKYLNSWPCDPRAEFDQWVCVGTPEPSTYTLVDPLMNVNGQWRHFTGYQPDILAGMASDFIQQTPADRPFFVMYAPTTPHLPADDPRYEDMDVQPPRGGSFNANTLTRGAPQYARRQSLTPEEIQTSDDRYVPMARSVRGLDDSIGSLLGSLGGRSRDTLVIFISDNGFLYGEHRRFGKNDPWEESVNVPMVVRYPAVLPVDQSFVSRALVQNVDLAATITDLAGIRWGADGRSFVPILQRKVRTVRTAALIEHCRGVSKGATSCSGLTFEGGKVMTPGFQGIVTERYKYIEYDDGSTQLIDLKHDPLETRNLAVGPGGRSSLEPKLAARLHAMMGSPLQTTIATGPGPTLDGRVAAFTYFSPSRSATYRCRLVHDGAPGAWKTCPGQFYAVGDLADGRYVFQVEGIDEGRFDHTPAARAFIVSTLGGPDVALTSHPGFTQAGTSASFTYSSSTPSVQFQCRLIPWGGDAPSSPCDPAGVTFDGLVDGSYRFEVSARDPGSGAVSDPAAGWFFRIDNAGPTVQFSTAPPAITTRQDAVLRFAPLEATKGGFACRLDGRPVECAHGSLRADRLKAGDHTLQVSATDLSGNVGVTSYTWRIDRSAPKVLIMAGPTRTTDQTTAAFDLWSSANPGMFVCQLDDLPLMPCFTAPVLSGLADGKHKLVVWSYDTAMNRSTPARYIWTVHAA